MLKTRAPSPFLICWFTKRIMTWVMRYIEEGHTCMSPLTIIIAKNGRAKFFCHRNSQLSDSDHLDEEKTQLGKALKGRITPLKRLITHGTNQRGAN